MISCNEFTEKKITNGKYRCAYPYSRVYRLTVRDKLLMHRLHQCPGNIGHHVFNQDRIFNKYVKLGHRAYVMYWRSHPADLAKMRNRLNPKK